MRSDVPELVELVAAGVGGETAEETAESRGGGGSSRGAKRQRIYEEHKSVQELLAGIKAGRYHQVKRQLVLSIPVMMSKLVDLGSCVVVGVRS